MSQDPLPLSGSVFATPFGPRRLFRFIQAVLGKRIWALLGWTAVMQLAYLNALVTPVLVGRIVNLLGEGAGPADLSTLYLFCAALCALGILEACLRYAAKPALADLTLSAAYRAKVSAFERLIDRPLSWHEGEMTGSKVERLTSGGVGVDRLLDQIHSNVMPVALTFIGVTASFVFYDLQYAAYACAFIVILWTIQLQFFDRERKLIAMAKSASEQAAGAYSESAGNILTIKTLNLEGGMTRSVSTYEETLREITVRQKRLSFRKYACFRVFDAFAYGGFVALAGNAAINGEISAGVFVVLITYFRSLDAAVRETISFMDSLVQNWIAVGRLAPLVLDEDLTETGTTPFPDSWTTIELDSVCAPYRNGRGGLNDISLVIRRGERLGVVGTSGSGKSSLAKVLVGALPVAEGRYTVDGTQFRSIIPRERSERISMVLQDSELFNMSLADNISVMREVTPNRLEGAIRIAALGGVVAKLAQGLFELIGERGYRLSGGERQRVGIARAICRDPEILILDEATSALDGETELAIHTALMDKLRGKTVVIIAHRLSTLRHVDRIIVLEEGRIVEEGSPEELLNNAHCRFAAMWRNQSEERAVGERRS